MRECVLPTDESSTEATVSGVDQAPRAGNGGIVPSVEHRWKPGQSGNPKGRPKGAHRLEKLVAKELESELEILDERMTKEQAMARALVDHFIKGNAAVIKEMLARLWPVESAPTVLVEAGNANVSVFSEPTDEQREALTAHVQDILCGKVEE